MEKDQYVIKRSGDRRAFRGDSCINKKVRGRKDHQEKKSRKGDDTKQAEREFFTVRHFRASI